MLPNTPHNVDPPSPASVFGTSSAGNVRKSLPFFILRLSVKKILMHQRHHAFQMRCILCDHDIPESHETTFPLPNIFSKTSLNLSSAGKQHRRNGGSETRGCSNHNHDTGRASAPSLNSQVAVQPSPLHPIIPMYLPKIILLNTSWS